MWTLEAFEQIPYGTIFAAGRTIDSPKGINMFNTEENLYWVAKKGGYNDWAIYCSEFYTDKEMIALSGRKVPKGMDISKIMNCEPAMLERYRR